jgi:DNA-binding CsgD family transcriptional regulator
LIARERELATLSGVLDSARRQGRSLLIRGAPGVGKTALLEEVSGLAHDTGWLVLRTAGTPSEAHLPLAALHRLIRPALNDLSALRPVQRDVLLGAFGLVEGPSSEIFPVSLAVLDLLGDLAARTPLVLLVDDSHWLDPSSGAVLAFIARRLDADRILLLATGRDGEADPLADGTIPELPLAGLDPASSAALMDLAAPSLNRLVRRRLLEAADGNPLALLELPKALPARDARQLPPGVVSLTRRLELAYAARAAELPPTSRDLLLLVALCDSCTIAEALGAGAVLRSQPVTPQDLDVTMAAGLLETDQLTVRLRHPLVRSAIYQSTPASHRRAAHAALAAVLHDNPDRRVWHRAEATIDADEEVATDLEQSAVRARARGLVPAAAQAFEHAAALSVSLPGRRRRLLSAAELAQQIGEIELSGRLLGRADLLGLDDKERLRSEWIRELLDDVMHGGVPRVNALVTLAEYAQRIGESELAPRFLQRAATRCWHMSLGPETEHHVLRAAEALGLPDADPRRVAILAYAAPLEAGTEVIELLSRRRPAPADDPSDLLLLGHAAACVGAFDEAELFCQAAAEGLRRQGRTASLCQALMLLAWAALRRGRWSVAIPAADECVRLSQETRQSIPHLSGLAAQAMMAAVRGDETVVATLTAQAESLARTTGNAIGLALIQLARATAAAAANRPGEAYELLLDVCRPGNPAHQRMQACWSFGTLAEVAAQSGNSRRLIEETTGWAQVVVDSPAAGVNVSLRLARAMLSAADRTEEQFRHALDGDLHDWPFEQGRLLLAYGRWLRRDGRVIESRAHLRAARDVLDRIDAQPWSEQARRELRAAGESSDRAAPQSWDGLSPRELQIAQLAAQGLGNKEIGEKLYLSRRTVQNHLYRIFPKLKITSRAQLAAIVATAAVGPPRTD